MTASTHRVGFGFQAPKSGTITKVRWITGTVTTGTTVDVRLETATGWRPTGTLIGTDTNGAQVISSSNDFAWFDTTLTSGATVTEGQVMAISINNSGSGNLEVGVVDRSTYVVPSVFSFNGTSWTRVAGFAPSFALEYSDTSIETVTGVYPFQVATTTNVNTGTTPDEVGAKFKLPFPFTITGCTFQCPAPAGNFDLKVYDSDGATQRLTVSFDKDYVKLGYSTISLYFTGTFDFLPNVFYRWSILPTSASNVTVPDIEVNTAVLMDSFDGGQDFHWTQRTDAGAWTDTVIRRPLVGLYISRLPA